MSNDYNKVVLMGRLTRDPEMHTVADHAKASLTLAVNRPYQKDDGSKETDFIPVIAWGKLAEVCKTYLVKGRPILIDGRMQIRTYEKNNETRFITEVVAESLQMLSGQKPSGILEPAKN